MSMSITVCSGCVCKQSSSTWRIIRASSSSSAAPPSVNFTSLHSAILKKDSDAVKEALDQLREVGWAKRWSSQPYVSRRTTSLRELTTLGIQNAENLAIPSVRNDAAFLFTVVGTTGFLGILAGQLPGDWGFFVPYLIGSISLVVLAVGSISPGLLQAAIGGFSTFFPDYQDRIARHEAAHFLGRDTTSSALTWFIWLVSTHPDVESKIREELNEAIPTEDGNKWRLFSVQEVSKLVFVQEVSKLVYLHSAICETLRLYPPVPFQHKEPIHADTLPSGHRIHPKMKIFFSLYAMGRMNFIWGDDCLDFKPERWITERGTVKHEPSYKFLAFNAGPRTCLGKEVAFTQMKTVAAAIINNYNVELVEGHRVAPNNSIILYMKRGLKAKLTKRW